MISYSPDDPDAEELSDSNTDMCSLKVTVREMKRKGAMNHPRAKVDKGQEEELQSPVTPIFHEDSKEAVWGLYAK
jgi:hypothetical protein